MSRRRTLFAYRRAGDGVIVKRHYRDQRTSQERHGARQILVRQWRILKILAGGKRPVTLRRIADGFGIHISTARKDLDTLEDAGFAISHRGGSGNQRIEWRFAGCCLQPIACVQQCTGDTMPRRSAGGVR